VAGWREANPRIATLWRTPEATRETLLWALENARERFWAAYYANEANEGDGDPSGPLIALNTYEKALDQLP
jgi:hypothetical protein